ncbi:MAG: hypothetical protein JOZ81_15755 [Chloroflexi bacterium]|nr:hypothetical protein [Chloroflexota bacterium]
MRNFRLDEAATSLLDYLTVPRSERDYGAYAARLVGAARRPVAAAVLLRDMLQLGVVQLASTAVQN